MTTVSDIVTGALKMSGVVDSAETVGASESADGLTSFNDMVQSWTGRSVYTGVGIVALTDEFPFEDQHILGCKAMLAKQIAHEYGKQVSKTVEEMARDGWAAIFGDFFVAEKMQVDDGLQNMPSQRWFLR